VTPIAGDALGTAAAVGDLTRVRLLAGDASGTATATGQLEHITDIAHRRELTAVFDTETDLVAVFDTDRSLVAVVESDAATLRDDSTDFPDT
jgi:hypothetical protein